MSVFKVELQNIKQGLLDLDPSTHPLAAGTGNGLYGDLGDPEDVSLQRQIFVAGPNRTYRLLKDGETFTDCNYWKRFAYPQVDREFAFINVVTDDGSVYSDIPEENTFAAGGDGTLSTDYTDTVVNFTTTYGGPARFLQVQNLDSTAVVNGELNGDTNVTFQLAGSETQIFNQGDLAITMLRLKSDTAGSSYSWIASVRSTCTS
jgi:hypothetical protein